MSRYLSKLRLQDERREREEGEREGLWKSWFLLFQERKISFQFFFSPLWLVEKVNFDLSPSSHFSVFKSDNRFYWVSLVWQHSWIWKGDSSRPAHPLPSPQSSRRAGTAWSAAGFCAHATLSSQSAAGRFLPRAPPWWVLPCCQIQQTTKQTISHEKMSAIPQPTTCGAHSLQLKWTRDLWTQKDGWWLFTEESIKPDLQSAGSQEACPLIFCHVLGRRLLPSLCLIGVNDIHTSVVNITGFLFGFNLSLTLFWVDGIIVLENGRFQE